VPGLCAGLIGAGDRKSVQPMAARDGEVGYDQLRHFIASGVWDAVPLEKALLAEADRMVGGADAWLIVDDTALPKKGEHSVGVAPPQPSMPAIRQAILDFFARPPPKRCPHCEKLLTEPGQPKLPK
jgi:SRSO17 transposase